MGDALLTFQLLKKRAKFIVMVMFEREGGVEGEKRAHTAQLQYFLLCLANHNSEFGSFFKNSKVARASHSIMIITN